MASINLSNERNNMKKDFVIVDDIWGLDQETINMIEPTMKFNREFIQDETTFVELENSKGEIICIFPERVIFI